MSDDVSREVDQLLKDREKYESWLERLEAQRGEASSRAYERVRVDYQQRLEDVLRRLKSHSESIKGKLADLAQQKARLEKERSGRTEELDEARLRHLVGEYGDDSDWQELEGRLQGALNETQTRIDDVEGEVRRLDEIMGLVERPVEKPARPSRVETPPEPHHVEMPSQPVGVEEPPEEERVEVSDEREPVRAVEERPVTATLPPEIIEVAEEESFEEEAAVESAAPEPFIEEEPAAEPMPEPPPREPPRPREPEVSGAGSGRGEEEYLSLGDLVLEDSDLDDVLSERAQAEPEKRAEPEPSAAAESEEGGEVGDELAFLESLSLGADEESEGFSFLEQRGSGTPQTIICPHCSAANDPAEWYCTECGEELPAE